jgi:hypothetical protein
MAWVEEVIQPKSMHISGLRQLNGSETFSLIQICTNKDPLWFKAVGEPNLKEYSITLTLARLLKDYLPDILSSKPSWHGWLMADAHGITLSEQDDSFHWELAVETFANLQIDSINMINPLLNAGCRDLRLAALLPLVDPFLETMQSLMDRQTRTPPAILTPIDLLKLGVQLKSAIVHLDSMELPDTLGHSDLNPGNIIVSKRRYVFLDWAEAHVGSPFFTLEYLIAYLRKQFPQLADSEKAVRASYHKRWLSLLSPRQIAEAAKYSPLIAVFAFAVSGTRWHNPEDLTASGADGFLRSLTRRMKHEADSLEHLLR